LDFYEQCPGFYRLCGKVKWKVFNKKINQFGNVAIRQFDNEIEIIAELPN
jgi:hypothetical protein